ncbi:MAG: sigma-54-dependent transcriptional regulator [Planctomycetota bacterium]
MGRVLVVDDEVNLCETLRVVLGRDGHEVHTATSAADAVALLDELDGLQVVLTDIRMAGMNGMELLAHCRKRHPDISVLVMTAFAGWDTAVEAMRLGAFNFITKPFDNHQLRSLVRRAVDACEHALAAKASGSPSPAINLVGNSAAVQRIQALIDQVGRTDATVLITGESGTGKELVANGIHYGSLRADTAFVRVNSGALTPTLLESELFGHVRGAFTGAVEDRPGLFTLAHGGSLFLDEVGDLAMETQVKLLRVLEVGEYLPVGSTEVRTCDVRVIAATNRDLQQMVTAGTFREDLFYRLNIIPIELPPLRERREDIPLLAGHLLARNARRLRRHLDGFTEQALEAMCDYAWPGNIRELDNRIQRSMALSQGDLIELDDVFGDLGTTHTAMWRAIDRRRSSSVALPTSQEAALEPHQPEKPGAALAKRIGEGASVDIQAECMAFERELMAAALERTDHNLTEAAKLLGLTFRQIRYKVKILGLR